MKTGIITVYHSFICDMSDPSGQGGLNSVMVDFWCQIDFLGNPQEYSRDAVEERLVDILLAPITLPYLDYSIEVSLINQFTLPYKDQYMFSRQSTYSGIYEILTDERDLPTLLAKPESFLHLSPLLVCPYIDLNATQFKIIDKTVFYVTDLQFEIEFGSQTLVVDVANKTLQNKVLLSEDSETLSVCQEVLQENFEPEYTYVTTSGSGSDYAQYVITVCCLALSIACLLITLVTYFLFPRLRTVAGKNNMALSGSLALAQVLLLAAVHL